MPSWFPRSTFGATLAAIYLVVAVIIVASERRNPGGGWITLKFIGSYLVTFPVSFLGDKLGVKPDFRRNLDTAVTIGICTVLAYFLGVGLAWLARALFHAGGAK